VAQSISSLKPHSNEPIWKAVKADRLTYLSNRKLRSFDRCLRDLTAKKIEGDFYEFGVALGGSAIILGSHLGERRLHGYDVFGMIPAPSEADEKDTHERYNVIASGEATGIGGDPYYGYNKDLYDTVVNSFALYNLTVDDEK
jgi:O-methyltransferase